MGTDPGCGCDSWQDGRGNILSDGCRSLTKQVRDKTEISAASGYGLITHLYNLRNGLVPRDAVSLCTVADYLGMVLTGRKYPLVHVSNAASLGFFDVRKGAFHIEAMKEMEIDPSILPEITEKYAELSRYRGISVTAALGDNQASFLGSVGIHKNILLLNMGTGGQISALSDQYFEAPGIEARPFVKGKYLLAGASLCGSRSGSYLFLPRSIQSSHSGRPRPGLLLLLRWLPDGPPVCGGRFSAGFFLRPF